MTRSNNRAHRPLAYLCTSRRNSGDATGETIWVRPDLVRTIALPWRCDPRLNPDAADYPTPYRITFDGADGIEQPFFSVDINQLFTLLPLRGHSDGP